MGLHRYTARCSASISHPKDFRDIKKIRTQIFFFYRYLLIFTHFIEGQDKELQASWDQPQNTNQVKHATSYLQKLSTYYNNKSSTVNKEQNNNR